MITAEELLANNIDGLRDALQDDDLYFFYRGVICEFAKELAKLHVTEALKVTSEDVDTEILCQHGYGMVDKESILNAYPLENIK